MPRTGSNNKPRRLSSLAPAAGIVCLVLAVALTVPAGGPLFNVSAAPFTAISPTLGAAGSFSVLAETTITNVPTSAIGEDVGLSPATGANVGLTDAEVAGTIYVVDGFGPAGSVTDPVLLDQAISDMMAAFTALDQPCTTTYAGVQDLTLVSPLGSGVYCADAFLLTGNLTLSGSGVWIFKSAATLTTSAGSSVTGGDPCNVWWRLVSAADIFPNSSIIGNILAGTSINLQTGASLNGRALAQAAVTLDSNTIFGPICAAPTPTPTNTPRPRPTRTPRPQPPKAPPTETPIAAPTDTPLATPTAPLPSILPETGVGPALDSRQLPAAAAGLGFLGLGLVLFGFALRRKRGT